MILARLPRRFGLPVVFVIGFVSAVLFAPIVLIPTLIEEPGEILRMLGEYYGGLVTLAWVGDIGRGDFLTVVSVMAAWAALQVVFLSPIVGRPKLESQGRSLVPSVIAAALIGGLGCAFCWVGAVEGTLALVTETKADFGALYGMIVGAGYLTGLCIWIGGGFVWYRLLARTGSMRDPGRLDRFVRWLFAGTCVELALGVLFFLQVRRRTECYCAMASFWSLCLGIATLLWMCGPWAVLLATRRVRKEWARGACTQCGYPRRTDATVCPECGAEIVGARGL